MASQKGTKGPDRIIGTLGKDAIFGRAGDDVLEGLDGNDRLKGGRGDDVLKGGGGNDVLKGGSGADDLDGGAGNDRLKGGRGGDVLKGGAGRDMLEGGQGSDTLDGGAGGDRINGGKGDDLGIYVASENVGAHDVYQGGAGRDTLRIVLTPDLAASAAVKADLVRFEAFLASKQGREDRTFHFEAFDLDVRGWEKLETVVTTPGGGPSDPPPGGTTNVAPVAAADTAVVGEDGPAVLVDVLANDSDPGDALSLAAIGPTTSGGLVAIEGSLLRYDPADAFEALAEGQTATDTVSYTVVDAAGATASATLSVTILGVNDAPVAADDAALAHEDDAAPVTGNVLANDADPDAGAALSVATAGAIEGRYGTLTLNADGSYSYALDNARASVQALAEGEVAADDFAYVVTDGAATAGATLSVAVVGRHDPFILADDLGDAVEDSIARATGDVLANDVRVDSAPLRVENAGVHVGVYGTLALAADGTYTYALHSDAPAVQSLAAGAVVLEQFSYRAGDGFASADATISFVITGTNDAPVAATDDVSGLEDVAISVAVLANDGDVDAGDALALVSASGAAFGTVAVGPDGIVTYTPDPNWHGTDSFAYVVGDGKAGFATGSVSVSVAAVADAPILSAAAGPVASAAAPIPLAIAAALADTDGSETLSPITISGVPAGAALSAGSDNGDGTWTLLPADLAGLELLPAPGLAASFSLAVSVAATEGSTGESAVATTDIVIVVDAAAEAPVIAVSPAVGAEDTPIALDLSVALVDTDGSETLSPVTISGVPAGAMLSAGTDNGDGTWTLAPADLAGLTVTPPPGSDAPFTLTVAAASTESFNGAVATATAALAVTVEGVADRPSLAVVAAASGREDTAIALDIAAALGDLDGSETLGVEISGVPEGATLTAGTNAGAGVWRLTASDLPGLAVVPAPDSDEDFVLSVRARAEEASGSTADATATITVSVAAVADAPVLLAADAAAVEDMAVALDISALLADTDGSETLSAVTIAGVPAGAALSAGTDNGDGTWTVAAAELPGLAFQPPANASGAYTLTLSVHSTEASTGETAAATASLTVTIAPVADAPVLAVAPVPPSGAEDTAIALDLAAALGDGSETLSVAISGVPLGATLSAGTDNGDGSWILNPGDLAGLTVTPALDLADDFTLLVTATASEAGTVAVTTASLTVTVEAVADAPSLVAAPAAGFEDAPIALAIAAALADRDGSESLSGILVSGMPAGAKLTAGTHNPDGTWSLAPADLLGLALVPAPDSDADIVLTFSVVSTEAENGSSAATSVPLVVTVNAVADAPMLALADSAGAEDSPIPLQLAAVLKDGDGSESLSTITIAGVPAGAALSAGADNGDGTWSVAAADLPGLALTPPVNFDGTIALSVSVSATEGADGDMATTSAALTVTVIPVLDPPTIVPPPVVIGLEDTPIALDFGAALASATGSEALARVVVAGVPSGATLSAGADNGDGSWTVPGADVAGLALLPAPNSDQDFTLAITAVSVDTATGAEASATATVLIVVDAVADAPILAAGDVVGAEDSSIPLSLAAALADADGSESLYVRITGLPEGAVLSAGAAEGGGSWLVPAGALAGLRLVPPPDFNGTLSLVATAVALEGANGGAAETTAAFTVEASPVNDAPTAPVDSDLAPNRVTEGAAAGTAVGIAAAATDPDAGSSVSYRLLDDAGGRFAIDAATGVVTVAVGAVLDYESAAGHTIVVEASDGALASATNFAIEVANAAPGAPHDANGTPNIVAEGVANGTAVGLTLVAADPAGGPVSYRLLDSAGGLFAIDAATGIVSVADGAHLDYESGATRTIVAEAFDGQLATSAAFTIAVLNAAPSAPVDADMAPNLVLENAANGTLVGLRAFALDPAGGVVAYSLADDADGRFAIDAATGALRVADGSRLDYESAQSHTIVVQATDGAKTSAAAFTVNLVNVVENALSLAGLGTGGGGGFAVTAAKIGDGLGVGVSGAGDVNGDGYADIVLGASFADPFGRTDAGAAYVIYGGVAGGAVRLDALSSSRGAVIAGAGAGQQFGGAVGFAGDVNRDGFDDLTSTAMFAGAPGTGRGYVVLGGTAQLAGGAVDAGALTGANGFTVSESSANSYLGQSAYTVGDFNRDGYADVAYGEMYGDSAGGFNQGRVYVVFGRAGFGLDVNATALNGNDGFVLHGAASLDGAGEWVRSAGDVNGDGADDLIVGAPGSDANGGESGAAYVVYGSPNGLGGARLASARLDGAILDGTIASRLSGASGVDSAGRSVSGAGDVNGDGFADLVVGAPQADPLGRGDAGAAYVVFGKVGGLGPDMNLSGLDGTNGFTIRGGSAGDNLGLSVAAVGDFNGDGLDDLAVAAPFADVDGAADAGRVYVIYGKAGGFAASIDLSQPLAESDGFMIAGVSAGDLMGRQVSGAGDVNGDGFDDIVIGAPGRAGGTGEAYVVHGGNYSGAATGLGGAGADVMVGTSGADVLFGRQGDDTLLGGAGDDRLVGGAGDDRLVGGAGDDVLEGGGGADTFVFADGSGADRIADFEATRGDVMDVSAFRFASFSALMATTSDVGANCVIALDGDDSVTLMGIAKAELSSGDFLL